MIIDFFLFLFIAWVCFYVPGAVLLDLLRIKLQPFETLLSSFVLGICLFLLLAYGLAWLGLTIVFYFILILLVIFYFTKIKKFSWKLLQGVDYLSFSIILLGSLSFLAITFFSGFETQKGLQFIGFNSVDGIEHLARIKNLVTFFPPTHPGLSSIPLNGYHYFFDFLVSRFVFLFHFSAEDLYFRFFPFLISLFYGGSFYLIAGALTKDRMQKALVIFFAYFASGLPTKIPILFQSVETIVNPSLILSITILLVAWYFLPRISSSVRYSLLAGILLGVLAQIKVYTGIVGIFSLVSFCFFIFFTNKKRFWDYILTLWIALGITVLTYFPNNWGAGSLIFAPFLFYEHYLEQSYFNSWLWKIKEIIYLGHHNYLRIVQLYLQAFLTVWVFSLGARLIIVIKTLRLFKKEFWRNPYTILFISGISIAFIIPTFFIQSVSVFDTVQLFWLILLLLNVPAGIIWGQLLLRANVWTKIAFIVFLFVFSWNPFIKTESQSLFGDKVVFSQDNVVFFRNISAIVPNETFVVFLPDIKDKVLVWKHITLLSGMTGRAVYYEKELSTYDNLNREYEKRKQNLFALNSLLSECQGERISKLLQGIGSSYLITTKPYPCLVSDKNVIKHFGTDGFSFYQFK